MGMALGNAGQWSVHPGGAAVLCTYHITT